MHVQRKSSWRWLLVDPVLYFCGNCNHNAKGKALGCSRLWGEVSWKLHHLSILLLVKYSWLSFTLCIVEHPYSQLYKANESSLCLIPEKCGWNLNVKGSVHLTFIAQETIKLIGTTFYSKPYCFISNTLRRKAKGKIPFPFFPTSFFAL